ncbi:hypothetical protein AWB79_06907 [Caballeronia hypogeia]|uniref:Uncharacterized protein n=1 Tax=Caballeronia hypogeia TaxID=1777140 RepID=A0A158DES8_9BURK|nr:hypothetical protein [Caballeronia hypogeia]SAK93089.1 hypothetical protein AWB79_06907 [Caballeronia hypogeia]
MEHAAKNFRDMTEQLKLTKELISLVHFVELNESGWVRKTLSKIVLAILCRSAQGMSRPDIHEAVRVQAAYDFSLTSVIKAIELLCSQKQVVEHPKGLFRVRESALNDIQSAIAATEAEEAATKSAFIAALQRCPGKLDGERVWNMFLELFLMPLIRDAGANTLNLLSGAAPLSTRENLQPLLDGLPTESREDVFRTVVEFLNPSSKDVRQFILKRVAASFFVAAVSLDSATVEALDKKRNTHSSIRLFLDTNTLFSVLGLHENEENDGVEGLLALRDDPRAPVKIKLFVFPETIEEANRVLSHAVQSMGTHVYPRPLAQAALRSNLSGVHAKYLEAVSKTSTPLSPKDYFAPYLSNLSAILKKRGIEVIDRSLLIGRQDQEVIDDVLDNQKFEERFIEASRRKSYEAIFHDLYIWHCIQRQRDLQLSSPLDAKEWFVTLDRRLLGFDAFKGKGNSGWVPVCVDPSTFIQFAQFWMPRSAQFEKALFGSLKLPLLFREFDSETEDVSLAIINRLSRIEAVGDFTADEIHTLLLNDAVRTRFRESPSDAEQTAIVRDELLTIHRETVEKSKKLEHELSEERTRKDALVQQLDVVSRSSEVERLASQETSSKHKAELAERQRREDALRLELEKERQSRIQLEESTQRANAQKELAGKAQKYFFLYVLLPFIALTVIFGALAMLLFTPLRASGVGVLLGAGATAGIVKLTAAKRPAVKETAWLRRVCAVLTFGWAMGAAGVGATVNALYSNFWSNHQDDIVKQAVATTTISRA